MSCWTIIPLRGQAALRGSVLLWYVLLLAGFPWGGVASKDLSHPFPCQYRRCGCASSDQCWRACCCFTPRERLAWARTHQVPVPSSLVQAAEESEPADPVSTPACCRVARSSPVPTQPADSKVPRESNEPSQSSCPTEDAETSDSETPPESLPDEAPSGFASNANPSAASLGAFSFQAAAACQGLSEDDPAAPLLLPIPQPTWRLMVPSCFLSTSLTLSAESRCDLPPVPPPRSTVLS